MLRLHTRSFNAKEVHVLFSQSVAQALRCKRGLNDFWLDDFQDISVAAKDSTAAQLEAIKIKYEEAVELRKKSELEIENFRPVGPISFANIPLFTLICHLTQLKPFIL